MDDKAGLENDTFMKFNKKVFFVNVCNEKLEYL